MLDFQFPTAVDGWLTEQEGKTLYNMGRGLRCLEIGSFCGRSSICIGQGAASLQCVDTFDSRGTPATKNTLSEFILNTVGLPISHYVGTMEGAAFRGHLFDFVFIDASHDYDSVINDIDLASRCLSPGASYAFHDYESPDWPEVRKACDFMFGRAADAVSGSVGIFFSGMTARNITVITPMSRPENLAAIDESLDCLRQDWQVQWVVTSDTGVHTERVPPRCEFGVSSRKSNCGNLARNESLDRATGRWIYFLDDDNIMHPQYPSIMWRSVSRGDFDGVLMRQEFRDGIVRLQADGSGGTDTAQFTLSQAIVGDKRWVENDYNADGVFFRYVCHEKMNRVRVVDETGCYYNFLRPVGV